jgi:hypothetical protein
MKTQGFIVVFRHQNMRAMLGRCLTNLPNDLKEAVSSAALQFPDTVSFVATTEPFFDPNPSFGGKQNQQLDDQPSRKASKRRVHGKISQRYPAALNDDHAVIVSSALGLVQCRMGGGSLPASPRAGSRRIDSVFQGLPVGVRRVRSADRTGSAPPIPIIDTLSLQGRIPHVTTSFLPDASEA